MLTKIIPTENVSPFRKMQMLEKLVNANVRNIAYLVHKMVIVVYSPP